MEEEDIYTKDGTVNYKGKPAVKKETGTWKACPYILGNECCERLAYYGMSSNLVVYFTKRLHQHKATASKNVSNWSGTCYITPLIGAFLADAYLGRYWTIACFSMIYVIGMTLLTLSASVPGMKPTCIEKDVCHATTKTQYTLSRKIHSTRINCTKYGNFLDLKPEPKTEFLDFDLPLLDPTARSRFDVIIIGAGPAGLRLAERVSLYGIQVCCIDPSPLSMWPNNYGVWVDEFESLGLVDCLDKTWPMTCVHTNENRTKYLDRPYGRVSREKLKTKLMEGCVSNGVKFHKSKVWKVDHQLYDSCVECEDGSELKASLIVDASGFASSFTEYDKPRNHGYQIAHGVLAEVESHPFDLDKMVLMDWRDSHLGNEPYLRENNKKCPTFLYAMPFDSNLVFLEETSLVSRPVLSYMEVKKRMVARLRHLGIKVKKVIEDEKCLIPMGGPLPVMPQSVMAIGGTAGIVHPSTGYMVARTMALAPVLADTIAECLGSTRMIRGSALHYKVWNGLWPIERKLTREFYSFGMETLLKLDLNGTTGFFDAFFDLDPYYWHGFLSSRLSLGELAQLSLSLFGHASNLSRFNIVTKCPVPLVKMVGNLALETI